MLKSKFADAFRFELHVFSCGHGDTILLNLFGSWFLIDCCLPSEYRTAFFDYIEKRNVSSLEAIFLTHPHHDHYTGMDEVIKYFSVSGREVKSYYDCGLSWNTVNKIMKARKSPRVRRVEYHKLYSEIERLVQQDRYKTALENTKTLYSHRNLLYSAEIFPLGPCAAANREAVINANFDLNKISIVLGVNVRILFQSFVVLLTGDMDGAGLNRALGILEQQYCIDRSKIKIVKVAHHGSFASHENSTIPLIPRQSNKSIAVISAGTQFDVLPDREVMRDYLSNNWNLFLTSHRLLSMSSKREMFDQVFELAIKPQAQEPAAIKQYSIRTTALPFCLSCTPLESRIAERDLANYQTAKSVL